MGCASAGSPYDLNLAVHQVLKRIMEHDIRAVATEQPPDMLLVHLSVVLIVGGTTDPSVINPDFLRHKAIVERGLEVEEPPISTPLFSQVAFKDGIAVIAEPNRFVIREQGDSLTEENCKSPEIVRRFLDEFSHLSYSAIGINLQGFRPSDDESAGSVVDALVDGGKWMLFRGRLAAYYLESVLSLRKQANYYGSYQWQKTG